MGYRNTREENKVINDIFEYVSNGKEETKFSNLEENELLLTIADYNDQKSDSRTDEIVKVLYKIKFWLTVIGIFFLVEIIATITNFVFVSGTIYRFMQIIGI